MIPDGKNKIGIFFLFTAYFMLSHHSVITKKIKLIKEPTRVGPQFMNNMR